jgi:hypothetical protein
VIPLPTTAWRCIEGVTVCCIDFCRYAWAQKKIKWIGKFQIRTDWMVGTAGVINYITMNLFTKPSSHLQYCDDIHLLHFYKIKRSLRQLPSKTASLLLRAIPIFFLSSRGQLSTCKRDTAVRMLLQPQIDHHWALQYTWERYHAHKLHFTCGIYELSICFLDLKFYDILLYSILRHLTLLNFTCHHFAFHILFSF